MSDLRLAVRGLLRHPAFTLVAVLTLALGIGATTSIFSAVEAVLLRPLPFREPARLVLLWGRELRAEGRRPLSDPNYQDIRAQATVFAGMAEWAAYDDYRLALTGSGEPEQVRYGLAGPGLFRVLGVGALAGRTLGDADSVPGAPRAALLTHALWRARFGADRSIVGRAIVLDGEPYTVVGVLPPSFRFGSGGVAPDLWLPSSQDPAGVGPRSRQYARGASYLGAVARLRQGVSLERARAELAQIAGRLAQAYPHFDHGLAIDVVPLHEQVVSDQRATLLILLVAVGLLLLIACANVGNLLLARASERAPELAVRVALGAGPGRLLRLLLTESLVLALAAGTAGVLLATWGTQLLARLDLSSPSYFIPYSVPADSIAVNGPVLAFAAALALLTGLAFGLAPAIQAARRDPQSALRGSGRGGHNAGRTLRGLLVVGELALSIVLVFGAVLLARSLDRLQSTDPGFSAQRVLAAELSLPRQKYDDPVRAADFYDALLARARALPGVQAAAATEQLPLSSAPQATDFHIAGQAPAAPGEVPDANYASVTPDYFTALRVPLRSGRSLTAADDERAPRVAIVNETFARRYFPGEDPIGKRVALSVEALRFVRDGPPILDFEAAYRTVVGVVGDVKQHDLASPTSPAIFVPLRQRPVRDVTMVLRAAGDPMALAGALRRTVAGLDPTQPVAHIRALQSVVDDTVGQPRGRSLLLGILAAGAALLAAVGLYGVLSYVLSQRTRELGVRLALGAAPGDLLRLVARDGLRLAGLGAAIGLGGALALGGVLRGFLYGVSAWDPLTLVVAIAVFGALTLAAALGPARRAARTDPVEALRAE